MTSAALEQLRAKALALSEPGRAERAHDLVAGLDGETEAGAVDDWDAEILRRLDQIDAGAAMFVSRYEFKRQLRQNLKPA